MTDRLLCPFCQQELDTDNYYCHCHCPHCDETRDMEGTEELWQALIDTKKKLDIFHEFITKLYLNGNITDEQLQWLKQSFNKEQQ